MDKFKLGCFCGCIGGFLLYVVETLCSLLPYMKDSDLSFNLLIAGIVLACVITIFVLLYGKATLTQMLFRCIVVFASYVCLFIIIPYIGIMNFIFEVCNIQPSSDDNVSGLVTVIFWAITACVGVITIAVAAIAKLVKKLIELK